MAGVSLRFRVGLVRFGRSLAVVLAGLLSVFVSDCASEQAQHRRDDAERAAVTRQAANRVENGRAELNHGRFEESLDVLRPLTKIRRAGESASRALLLQGKAAWALGDLELAESSFIRVLEEHGLSFEAPKAGHKLAWLALVEGDRETASHRFEVVSRKDSTLWPEASVLAAWTAGEPWEGGMRTSRDVLHRRFWEAKKGLLDRSSGSVLAFAKVRAQESTRDKAARAGFFQAKALLGDGQVGKAADLWKEVAQKRPDEEWGSRSNFKLAVMLLVRGEVPEAKARLAAVRQGPLKAEAVALRRWLDTNPTLPPPLR